MKVQYTLIAIALIAALSTAAVAKDMPATEGDKSQMMQKFEERKAEKLKHIGERISELQKKQSCIQAATDVESMKACMPNRAKKEGKPEKAGEGSESAPQ